MIPDSVLCPRLRHICIKCAVIANRLLFQFHYPSVPMVMLTCRDKNGTWNFRRLRELKTIRVPSQGYPRADLKTRLFSNHKHVYESEANGSSSKIHGWLIRNIIQLYAISTRINSCIKSNKGIIWRIRDSPRSTSCQHLTNSCTRTTKQNEPPTHQTALFNSESNGRNGVLNSEGGSPVGIGGGPGLLFTRNQIILRIWFFEILSCPQQMNSTVHHLRSSSTQTRVELVLGLPFWMPTLLIQWFHSLR